MTERKPRAVAAKETDDPPQKPADIRAGGDSSGHGAKSEAVRERAILALLSEKTITGAARCCGVNEKTLRRWMADDDEFKRDLADARGAMFQAGVHRLQALTAVAINTLETLMGPRMPPTVRLGAARTVAELSFHQYDEDTILRRLDEMEAHRRAQQRGRR